MKYAYEFSEQVLKSGKKILVAEVDKKIDVFSDFLFSDIQYRDVQYVLDVIDAVTSGESDYRIMIGNSCDVRIYQDKTTLVNFITNERCEIETSELREFVVLWGDEVKRFKERNK